MQNKFVGNFLRRKGHFGNLGIGERLILCILDKYAVG
jgi:hypothetical protein